MTLLSYRTRIALICAVGTLLVAGCGKQNDPVAQAEKKDVAKGVPRTERRRNQGDRGRGIHLRSAAGDELRGDDTSLPSTPNPAQFKAPFNEINNQHRVATPEDTAVVTPNSDTPYSMVSFDLRAEPVVVSVPAVPKSRYYSVQLIDGNTYNFGYIGTRSTGSEPGSYLVAGPDWKGDTPAGIKKVFTSSTPFALAVIRTQLFNRRRHCQRREGAGGIQGATALGVPQATCAAAGAKDRFRPGDHRGHQGKLLRVPRCRVAVRARRRRMTRPFAPSSPRLASDRARRSISRSCRRSTRPRYCWE